jgi:hypothetical protein
MRKLLVISFGLMILTAGCSNSSQASRSPETRTATAPAFLPNEADLPVATSLPSLTLEPSTALSATVWTTDPWVSILTYHQFAGNHAERSTGLKVRFEDFEAQLNMLYDAGFSLIRLEDWMEGNMVVPEGRRPLILSMDDLYFNNQLRLDENGEPLPETGIGILWNFYQEHPDFGFSCALFINLGNKLYADPSTSTWEMELAEAVVWGIDHDLMPYNHFYTHPQLDLSEPGAILWEAEENDIYLRELISMAGREDLIPELDNILALTYGVWPIGNGVNVMLSYTNPEGEPVRGVVEIGPISVTDNQPPVYAPEYDPLRINRHVASPSSIDYLVAHAEDYPRAQVCDLGMVPDWLLFDSESLSQYVLETATTNNCADGVYVVNQMLFRISMGTVEKIIVSQQ